MGKPYPTPRNPLKPPTATTTPNNPNRFKTAAQREAERQAAAYENAARSYSGTSTLNDEKRLRDALARNTSPNLGQDYNQTGVTPSGLSALEQSQRYGASGNGGDTSFYTDYAKFLSDARKNQNPNSPVAPQNGGSGSGSGYGSYGGGGGSASPQPTLADQLAAIQSMTGTIDPNLRAMVPTTGELEVMYGRLTDSLNKTQANLNTDYQKSIDAVKGNYSASNNLLNQAISGDNASLAQAAANLGVENWSAGPTAQGQNELLNRLLGTSSQNQATDLSWFEKMKNLDTNQFGDYLALANVQKQGAIEDSSRRLQELQQMADEVARNQAMAALEESLMGGSGGGGGGYGGRRSFGGGGSSSAKDAYRTLSQSATQTGDLDFAGFANELSTLPPDLQQLVTNYWVMGGSSGEGAAKVILNDIVNGRNPLGGDQNAMNYAYQMFLRYTPGLAPIYSQTVQDKTSQSTKQYGVPPITQLPPLPVGSSTPKASLKGISDRLKATTGAKKKPTTKNKPKSVSGRIFG